MKKNDTNHNDDFLFNITDYQYINIIVFEIIILIVGGVVLYFNYNNNINSGIGKMVLIYGTVSVIYKIIMLFIQKNKIIRFYKNKISRLHKPIDIYIDSNVEIYKMSSLWYLGYSSVKRPTNAKKLLGILISLFIFPLLIAHNIVLSVFRKNLSISEVLIVIGRTDKEVIVIEIPKNDKDEYSMLLQYFRKYLNIEINQLKALSFIPMKG